MASAKNKWNSGQQKISWKKKNQKYERGFLGNKNKEKLIELIYINNHFKVFNNNDSYVPYLFNFNSHFCPHSKEILSSKIEYQSIYQLKYTEIVFLF